MWLKFIILSCISTSAWAFKFTTDFQNGFYWQKTPINITVVDSDPRRKEMIQDLAQAAIMDWQDNSELKLWDYTGEGTKNIIRWSTNFAQETRMDANTVLAVAIRYTDGPYFARTEIVINGGHAYNQNEGLLRTTLTHELGHTMGLDHSEVGDSVMAPTLQPMYTGLHSDDVDGIQAAFAEMDNRQKTGFISRFAYKTEQTEPKALSCGTIGPVAQATPGMNLSALASMAGGILISFVRKILSWFKSRF